HMYLDLATKKIFNRLIIIIMSRVLTILVLLCLCLLVSQVSAQPSEKPGNDGDLQQPTAEKLAEEFADLDEETAELPMDRKWFFTKGRHSTFLFRFG
ncbi:hypothetical protein BOX15_Mlig014733g1, partial [Macrostomum lignano]